MFPQEAGQVGSVAEKARVTVQKEGRDQRFLLLKGLPAVAHGNAPETKRCEPAGDCRIVYTCSEFALLKLGII